MSLVHSDASHLHTHRATGLPVLDIIRRLEAGERTNALDVLVEIAMFEPCEEYSAVVSNNAGTKVIYSKAGGGFETCLAREWVREPLKSKALAALKATTGDSVGIGAADEPDSPANGDRG